MGTLAALVPILGLWAGTIVAKFTKSELKLGKKYFVLLQHVLVASIFGTIIWQIDKNWAIIIGVVVFAAMWKTKFEHLLELSPILAVPAVLAEQTQIPILLYFIPTGTLNLKENKRIIFVSAAYIILVLTSSLTF